MWVIQFTNFFFSRIHKIVVIIVVIVIIIVVLSNIIFRKYGIGDRY